jgi:nucleoside-diphosphate-sugar epimerase
MTRASISVRQLARCMAEARREGETPFETFTRYSNDPEFAAEHDADRAEWQRRTHALIDEGVRRARESRERGV